MTLQELSVQYQESARLLAEGLALVRAELKTARGDAALDLRRREELLAEELGDTLRTARWLRDYYR